MTDIGMYFIAALGPFAFTTPGALWMLAYFFFRNREVRDNRDPLITKLLLLLVFLSGIAVAFSPKVGFSLGVTLGQALMITFGVLGGRYLVKNQSLSARLILVSGAALALSTGHVLITALGVERSRTLVAGPNGTGTVFLIFGGVCITYLWTIRKKWGKPAALVLYLLALAGIVATGSRGALLGFLAMSLIVAGFNRKGLVLLLIFALGFGAMMIFSEKYYQRFSSRLSIESNSDRVRIWTGTMNMIKAHPLTGVGPGMFAERYKEYKPPEEHYDWVAYAHNYYLNVGAEFGLPTLAIFLVLLSLLIAYGVRLSFTGNLIYRGIFASFVGTLIHQLVDMTAWGGNIGILMWLLAGLIVAIHSRQFLNRGETKNGGGLG